MYPKLTVDIDKIKSNVKSVVALCASFGVDVCGVTKAVCGDERIVQAYIEGGVTSLGDSRLSSIARYKDAALPKLLIRIPQVHEVRDVVETADVSVNTEIATLEALERACEESSIAKHGIMLMVDLGDLREGIIDEKEFEHAVSYITGSKHLYLYGVGANLNCLSFILPDEIKMRELVRFAEKARNLSCESDFVVSGGNSTNLNLMSFGGMPAGINSLRLGESLLFGRERASYRYLDGTVSDAFKLQATILELKNKPSAPWGVSGVDSYGNKHVFEDKGIRRRALLAFGHQDIDTEVIWPLDDGISIIDSSSDYTVVDITDAGGRYEVGDLIEFRCGYHAVARAFSSPYINVTYL